MYLLEFMAELFMMPEEAMAPRLLLWAASTRLLVESAALTFRLGTLLDFFLMEELSSWNLTAADSGPMVLLCWLVSLLLMCWFLMFWAASKGDSRVYLRRESREIYKLVLFLGSPASLLGKARALF